MGDMHHVRPLQNSVQIVASDFAEKTVIPYLNKLLYYFGVMRELRHISPLQNFVRIGMHSISQENRDPLPEGVTMVN